MIRRRAACSIPVIFLIAVAAYAQTQELPSQSADEVKAGVAKLYADAHPYLYEPFPELKKVVHELNGMTPASSQKHLPGILDQVGIKADDLLQQVPDLVADEAVNQIQWAIPKSQALGCVGLACKAPDTTRTEKNQTFQYLILTHPGALGLVVHSEARVAPDGKSVDPMMKQLNFQGFLPVWVLFYPVNQAESRFRYLGEQQIDGHNTFVIGFAQLPGSVASLDRPVLLQGIAWVDQGDFKIVRLHTDLLAPIYKT